MGTVARGESVNRSVVFALVGLLALGCLLGGYMLTRPRDLNANRQENSVATINAPDSNRLLPSASPPKTPVEQAESDYLEAEGAADRIEIIRKVAALPDAKSNMPLLRKALVADASEDVQLEALTKSVELAEKEGLGTLIEVIRGALSAPKDKVQQQALREARKHPSPLFVPDLIEIADGKAAHRFLAVDALAFTEDPRAKAKVLEVASKTDGDKTERVRAVALLAKTRDTNANELLHQLSGSSDDELRKVANEVIEALKAK
ncbi:MAG: hypothetical protein IT462_08670 [Planctomycetes bacterium]|nr:hypothetical protein [Planctomycetota bacterium]